MTDEQIIKALECCPKDTCEGCPLEGKGILKCMECFERAADMLKRQKAEIDKLKVLLRNADATMYALIYGGEQ